MSASVAIALLNEAGAGVEIPAGVPVVPQGNCALADPTRAFPELVAAHSRCPFHYSAHVLPAVSSPDGDRVPVVVDGGTFKGTVDTVKLLESIGGTDTLVDMCIRFYSFAIRDQDVRRFLFDPTAGAGMFGERLGYWIGV